MGVRLSLKDFKRITGGKMPSKPRQKKVDVQVVGLDSRAIINGDGKRRDRVIDQTDKIRLKARRTRCNAQLPALPVSRKLLEPGVILARGVMEGRAVPWKTPTILKGKALYDKEDQKRFLGWQRDVHLHAREHMLLTEQYGGPVYLKVTFWLKDAGSMPDQTNLEKAFEDAIQGSVYCDDSQVCRKCSEVAYSGYERVEWSVETCERRREEDLP